MTWIPEEIAKLDAASEIKGWARTGYTFKAYTAPRANTVTACRYYIPPDLGDSHFFGRNDAECVATGRQYPTLVLEDPAFMYMLPPIAGECPADTVTVYRVFNNRPGANHRYMTDRAVREQMLGRGWLLEGDGADRVITCASQ